MVLALSQRQIRVLICVIDLFIETGEPVGSSTVAAQKGIDVSSATIRNVMASLEDEGLLYQPYTSAGRMPTWSAMRVYVDHLASTGRFTGRIDADWKEHLGGLHEGDVESMVRSTGLVISELSQLTSIISSPEVTQIRLRELQLSWLSEERVLVILITQDGRVFNRVVRLDEPIDRASLMRMQNFLSELVVGLSLREVRKRVQTQMKAAESEYRKFMRRALKIGEEVVELATRSELFVEGTIHMLDVTELAHDIERVRDVMRSLEDRERILEVLERVCETPRARTLIGPELGDDWGEDLSLVACGYFHDGHQVGLVGILGPMRMNYTRMIPLVEHAAGVLSKELEEFG